jgi:hypothetical protein
MLARHSAAPTAVPAPTRPAPPPAPTLAAEVEETTLPVTLEVPHVQPEERLTSMESLIPPEPPPNPTDVELPPEIPRSDDGESAVPAVEEAEAPEETPAEEDEVVYELPIPQGIVPGNAALPPMSEEPNEPPPVPSDPAEFDPMMSAPFLEEMGGEVSESEPASGEPQPTAESPPDEPGIDLEALGPPQASEVVPLPSPRPIGLPASLPPITYMEDHSGWTPRRDPEVRRTSAPILTNPKPKQPVASTEDRPRPLKILRDRVGSWFRKPGEVPKGRQDLKFAPPQGIDKPPQE